VKVPHRPRDREGPVRKRFSGLCPPLGERVMLHQKEHLLFSWEGGEPFP